MATVGEPGDHLVGTADRELLREITGVEPDRRGTDAVFADARRRVIQRVGLGDAGGAIIAFIWPGELVGQAKLLYDGARGPRLLAAAANDGWTVELRPHLAYWRARPPERLYMHPRPTMTTEEYVSRWAGLDGSKIGAHDPDTVGAELWPWLRDRGYSTGRDDEMLESFLQRVAKANRDVHLRPGLAVFRRWDRGLVIELRRQDRLAAEIRLGLNSILASVNDPPLVGAAA